MTLILRKEISRILMFMLTRNADSDRYSFSTYVIGVDACGSVSLSDGIVFGKKSNNT